MRPPCPERLHHVLAPSRITAPDEYTGRVGSGVGVSEEHDVDPPLPQDASGDPRESLPFRSVQYFHGDATIRRRDGVCVTLDALGRLGPEAPRASDSQQYHHNA